MIPVKIRIYEKSILASLISVIGTIADALLKLLALACAYCMFCEDGVLAGLIMGSVMVLIAVFLGAMIQKVTGFIAGRIVLFKVRKRVGA